MSSAEGAVVLRSQEPVKAGTEALLGEGLDLQQYWHILRKRRLAVGLTCLVVMVGTMVATFLMRSVYRSVVTIQIERDNPNILSFQEVLKVDAPGSWLGLFWRGSRDGQLRR